MQKKKRKERERERELSLDKGKREKEKKKRTVKTLSNAQFENQLELNVRVKHRLFCKHGYM